NEIAALCEATEGTDVDQVLDGLHLDRRITTPVEGHAPVRPGLVTYLRAGCGFGGSCLPKDVTALRVYGKNRGVTPDLLNAVLEVNKRRPETLVGMVKDAIGNLGGARVAVLGIAFKQGTDDLRDSPALAILRLLRSEGAKLCAYDPFVSSLPDQPDV